MPNSRMIVLQGTDKSDVTASSALANAARSDSYEEAIFVAPFVTKEGVKILTGVAEDAEVGTVRWLIGLDGTITTPTALRTIADSDLTEAFQGWQESNTYPSLHAKTYVLLSRNPSKIALYIGSANATGNGLSTNIEAGVLFVLEGAEATRMQREILAWFEEITSSSNCVTLDDGEIQNYTARYQKPKSNTRRIAHVVGVERHEAPLPAQGGDFKWIKLAVTGGSANQIEICKAMVPFFTGGRQIDSADFKLVDAATGRTYSAGYRLRPGNAGHRVEVDTELARNLALRFSHRRDLVLFRKTPSTTQFVIEIWPAKSRATKDLIEQGKKEGRVHYTINGPGRRIYYD